jgi:hypothetical protein
MILLITSLAALAARLIGLKFGLGRT